MSAYPPPIENVPIFDSSLFNTTTPSLTQSEADKLYLKYPVGQGTETIPNLVITGNETIEGNETLTGNLILNGTANTNYIEFPDGTKQYTAPTVTPNYTITNVYTSSQTITPPANTYKMDISIFGSGGLGGKGIGYGSYFVYGGSGAGGNMISTTNISISSSNTLTLVVQSGVQGGYTQLTFNITGITPYNVAQVYNGGNGSDGQSSGTGVAGAVNNTASILPTNLPNSSNWFQYTGLAGQTGLSDGGYPDIPAPTTIGGGINITGYTAGQIGCGQSWANSDDQYWYWGASTYTGGGCIITWYKTA